MDKERQFQVYRAIIKEVIRKKGIQIDKPDFVSGASQEIEDFNKTMGLNPPFKAEELIEIYLEFGQELTREHFEQIRTQLFELKQKSQAHSASS